MSREPKRVPIYLKFLHEHVERILEELQMTDNKLAEIARSADPKFPYKRINDIMDTYHISGAGMVVKASVTSLHEHYKSLSVEDWDRYTKIYLSVPTRGQATHKGDETQDVTVEGDVLDMCDEIAEHIKANDIQVPYIISRWGTSYKVVVCLAIIYLGLRIKNRRIAQN